MVGEGLIDYFKLFFLRYKNTVIVWPTVNKKWCGLKLQINVYPARTSVHHEYTMKGTHVKRSYLALSLRRGKNYQFTTDDSQNPTSL